MPQSAPTVSIEDLITWIDQCVVDLQAFVGPHEQVASSLAFEMMLCAAVASAIPGANMAIVEAGISYKIAIDLTPHRARHFMTLPHSHQHFVIQFQGALINGSGVIDRRSLDEMVCQVYRDELELLGHDFMDQPMQVKYQTLQPTELAGFASGTWTQFVIDELGSRYRAHLSAGQLEQSTFSSTVVDGKASVRRM